MKKLEKIVGAKEREVQVGSKNVVIRCHTGELLHHEYGDRIVKKKEKPKTDISDGKKEKKGKDKDNSKVKKDQKQKNKNIFRRKSI